MSRFYRRTLSKFNGYTPGEQINSDVVKLNTNENPYKLDIEFSSEILKSLNKYPDPLSDKLRSKIAQKYNLSIDNIIAGNGSDDILRMIFQAFADAEDKIAYCVPTYTLYKVLAGMSAAECIEIESNEDLSFSNSLIEIDAKIIIICSPNSPTGIVTGLDFIEETLSKSKDRLIVVDEAYADFCGITSAGLVNKYNNIIVCRTFSKSHSLAGIRLGWAASNEELINELMSVKDSYNVNSLTQYIGEIAFDADISRNLDKIISERERVKKSLEDIEIFVYPSGSNFLLLKLDNALQIKEKLKDNGVLVRHFNEKHLEDKLRVTIGTEEENDIFLEKIKKLKDNLSFLSKG